MSPAEHPRARALFEAALKRDAEERDKFLDEACGGDVELRRSVAALIDARSATIERGLDGRLIGPYIIRDEIGRGGMGVVYLAEDTRLARRVALKAIAADAARETRTRERLRQEARAAARLSHQNIATVYALEEIGSELYLACEYVAGRTLRTILKSEQLALPEAVSIALQVARALAVAHASGVIHRDLKPENIIRTSSGVVKILDFGIARVEDAAAARLTQAGTIIGTPAYMAPEQAQGREVDFRTDLFSLGIVFYEMITGSNPFDAGTIGATLDRIVERDPVPLSRVINGGTDLLDRIVATCLQKNPAARYRSTNDLVDDLDALEKQVVDPSLLRAGVVNAGPMRLWWEVHQVVIAVVYVLALYPSWLARAWLPAPWGLVMFFAALSCAAIGTIVRLNLSFASRVLSERVATHRTRTLPWIRVCEAGLISIQLLTAILIGADHQLVATLLVAVSLSLAVAALIIEPMTTDAAFPETR